MDLAWWQVYGEEAGATFQGELWSPLNRLDGVMQALSMRVPNSGASAIALAAHWGAKRIFLLGFDCKAEHKRHWHEDHPKGLGNAGSVEKWPAHFREVAKPLKGLDIINCSRDTALDVFPTEALEDVLAEPTVAVACWLWGDGYRPEHVNVLASMLDRHLPQPHRLVCITDRSQGFSPNVEVLPTPRAAQRLADLKTPEGERFPSCYRRLWMFSEEAKCLGSRVLLLDIDVVITGSIGHLFRAEGDFVGWRPKATWGHVQRRLGGGMYLLTPGAHPEVFDDFQGESSIREAREAGYRGSDQAWISHKLAAKAPILPEDSGIYSIRDLVGDKKSLPSDACLVQFNGPTKPWQSSLPWVKRNWR